MSLINDDVSEVKLLEVVLLLDDHLIGCHHHVELAGLYELVLLVCLHVISMLKRWPVHQSSSSSNAYSLLWNPQAQADSKQLID